MRLVHKATDGLSVEAQRILIGGFRAKWANKAIAREIFEATGERVAERTVARRGAEWRTEQSRRLAAKDQMLALVEAMKEGNVPASEMIQALATDALLTNPNGFAGADPLKVQDRNLRAEEIALKRAELAVKQRALELNEKKFSAMREREEKAKAALEKAEPAMTPDERLREIQEIYGIKKRG